MENEALRRFIQARMETGAIPYSTERLDELQKGMSEGIPLSDPESLKQAQEVMMRLSPSRDVILNSPDEQNAQEVFKRLSGMFSK